MDNRVDSDLNSNDLETLKNRISKVIKKFNVKEYDEVTNILRRRYPIYNKRKRKFIKKIVSDVIVNQAEVANSSLNDNESICVDEQQSDHSADLTLCQHASNFYSGSNSENETNDYKKSNENEGSQRGAAFDCVEIVSDEDVNRKRPASEESTNGENGLHFKRLCSDNIYVNSQNKKIVTFKDVHGREKVLESIKEIMKRNDSYDSLKKSLPEARPTKYFLLCGPSRSGKSFITRAIMGEYNLCLYEINLRDFVDNGSTNVKRKLSSVLEAIDGKKDCLVVLDNLDCLTNNSSSPNMKVINNIVYLLCLFIDEQRWKSNMQIIGTAVSREFINPNLLHSDRFTQTIFLPAPTFVERVAIFEILAKVAAVKVNVDFRLLAEKTPAFQFVDLKMLFDEASLNVRYRQLLNANQNSNEKNGNVDNFYNEQKDELENIEIDFRDFEQPLKIIKPSYVREQQNDISVPETTLDNIGSLNEVKEHINSTIFAHLKDPIRASLFKKKKSSGILFFGPPGCGKTLIAKAIANEGGLNFISVKGGEFFNMYVGESERSVRLCFENARNIAPSMIFFDEIDGLCSQRSESTSTPVTQRVVTQLLSEMDGLFDRGNVYLLAATNQPDKLDPALLRPGRFDEIIYVGLPDAQGRYEILKAITREQPPLDSDVDLKEISELKECENLTGADLQNLIDKAADVAFCRPDAVTVNKSDILQALERIRPSVSNEQLQYYSKMKQRFDNMN